MMQEELKQLLDYNEETGIFTWRKQVAKRIKIGDVAGRQHHSGYWHMKIKGKLYRAHRLAWLYMFGSFPEGDLDHKNGIRYDNRIANLRLATRTQNQANAKNRNNLTGCRGVSVQKSGRFQAQVRVNNRCLSFGTYDTPQEAGAVAAAARHELFGEFARGCG